MNAARRWAWTVLGVLGASLSSKGQCGDHEVQELFATEAEGFESFGGAVAVHGDLAIVGARTDGLDPLQHGSAFVYRHDGVRWVPEQKLVASQRGFQDFFGSAVDIEGDVAVVGAPYHDGRGTDSGAVYVFRHDGTRWNQEQKLLPESEHAPGQLGASVSLSGDLILAGAPEGQGAANLYRFEGDVWTLERSLYEGGAPFRAFGSSVCVQGDRAVVGAPGDDGRGDDAGSVSVYRHRRGARWLLEAELSGSDTVDGDRFGHAVAVDAERIVVGAIMDDDSGGNSGAAYVFENTGTQWEQAQKLLDSRGQATDQFGCSVALDGDRLAIGAWLVDGVADQTGLVKTYREIEGTWVEHSDLTAREGGPADQLGVSLSLDGDRVLAGAWGRDAPNGRVGAALGFELADLGLAMTPELVDPGEPLTMTTCGGMRDEKVLFAVVELNSTPVFVPLMFGRFDAGGVWSLSSTVPPGHSGLVARFQSIGFYANGRAGTSRAVAVSLR